MLVSDHFDEKLDWVVTQQRPFEVVVFDLIDWADSNAQLPKLLRVAAGKRSQSQELADLARESNPDTLPHPTAGKLWRIAVHSTLQPAPHFAGRAELLAELSSWAVAPNDPVRVRALVAAGGTGKTAVAEKVLAGLPDENPFGVFVWSFYENPQTEAFLRAACEYFFGEAPKDTGGLLEHLQRGLRAADLPHLLILDGLELVQATGTSGRPRGELEDPLMKRFLRWLAAGRGTRAKALITSRFPLLDLADWGETGFCPRDLEDLDPPAGANLDKPVGTESLDEYPASDKPTAEEQALLGAAGLRTAANDDVEVYYVYRLSKGSGGEAFRPAKFPTFPALADSVVVATKMNLHAPAPEGNRIYFVSAHEVGHVLTDNGHYPHGARMTGAMRTNLMVDANFFIYSDTIFDSRRLTSAQETAMLTARPTLLHAGG